MTSARREVDLVRLEAAAREQWMTDPVLRREFLDDLESYLAYRRYEALDLISLCGPGKDP